MMFRVTLFPDPVYRDTPAKLPAKPSQSGFGGNGFPSRGCEQLEPCESIWKICSENSCYYLLDKQTTTPSLCHIPEAP